MFKDLKAQIGYFEADSECLKKAYDKHISECAMLNKSMIRNSINTSTNISDGKTVKYGNRFDRLEDIPNIYLYLVFIVVGGNYGISVTNLIKNTKK